MGSAIASVIVRWLFSERFRWAVRKKMTTSGHGAKVNALRFLRIDIP